MTSIYRIQTLIDIIIIKETRSFEYEYNSLNNWNKRKEK